ncbi:MAG: hypothetical protein ABR595_03500 [Psychroflexus sp.]
MRKPKTIIYGIILLFVGFFLASSCASYILNKNNLLSENDILFKKLPSQNKTVYFLGLRHLGLEAYYKNLSTKIDSLNAAEFNFILERKSNKKDLLQTQKDTIAFKKFRKIMSFSFADKAVQNKIKSLLDKYELVIQPDYNDMNVSPNSSKHVDLSLSEMIQAYEDEQGIIELYECDNETDINSDYDCDKMPRKERNYFFNEIVLNSRNQLIVDAINNSKHDKILVLYGEKHFEGISEILEKQK